MTAAKADEWIPIRPGTDGALALGIAHVLMNEDLYDQRFVEAHTFGFEAFKGLILEEYPPEAVAKITGVSAKTIERLARELAEGRPSLAIADRGVGNYTNGLYSRWAVHCLNALLGSIDAPGGVLIPPEIPPGAWPPLKRDALAKKGHRMPRIDGAGGPASPLASSAIQALPDAIQRKEPYEVEALLFYYANPAFSDPRLMAALAQVPFIVSFSPFMDETTEWADLVLPDHTYLERWQDHIALGTSYPLFGLSQPVVKPFYDTRHTGDVLLALVGELGSPFQEAFPWPDFETLLKEQVRGIFEARRGILAEALDEPWYETFKRMGEWPTLETFEAFWKLLRERGGWWDPEYRFGQWERAFRTPSGRFEFFSQRLKAILEGLAKGEAARRGTRPANELERILQRLGIQARGDRVYLPHYEEPRFVGEAGEFPLHLNLYRPMALAGGPCAQQPFLQEIVGPHVHMKWDSWIEINPHTAKALGVADGDWVWVESPIGKLKVRAKLYPGAMPEVVNMPYRLGHTAFGRFARGKGVNPGRLTGREADSLGGSPARFATRVKVYKA